MWDRGQVKSYMSANCLHGSRNGFTISQYFVQILCAQNVAQRRLSQKSSRMMGVFNVGHRNGRVRHAKINHGVHRHRHAVLGQHLPGFFFFNLFISQFNIIINGLLANLLRWNVKHSRTQIHFGVSLDARQYEENSFFF